MDSNRLRQRYFTLGLLLVASCVASAYLSPAFLSPDNLSNLLLQAAPLGVTVLGQTFVLLVRGIDLSVASTIATSAVIATAFRTENNELIPVIVAACLACGAVVGLFNGYLTTARRVSPFLATLATTITLQGLRFVYTRGTSSGLLPSHLQAIGHGRLSAIPYNGLILLALASCLIIVLSRTVFGRQIYLVGGNPVGAYLAGVNVTRVTVACYVICSMLASLAGLLLVGYVGLVDNWTGRGYELDSIVAAVMGGVAISGGQGTVTGALLGTAVLTTLFNMVVLIGMPIELQQIVKGVVIVAAASLYARRL